MLCGLYEHENSCITLGPYRFAYCICPAFNVHVTEYPHTFYSPFLLVPWLSSFLTEFPTGSQ